MGLSAPRSVSESGEGADAEDPQDSDDRSAAAEERRGDGGGGAARVAERGRDRESSSDEGLEGHRIEFILLAGNRRG